MRAQKPCTKLRSTATVSTPPPGSAYWIRPGADRLTGGHRICLPRRRFARTAPAPPNTGRPCARRRSPCRPRRAKEIRGMKHAVTPDQQKKSQRARLAAFASSATVRRATRSPADGAQQLGIASVAACEGERGKEPWDTLMETEKSSAGIVSQSAGEPTLADAAWGGSGLDPHSASAGENDRALVSNTGHAKGMRFMHPRA